MKTGTIFVQKKVQNWSIPKFPVKAVSSSSDMISSSISFEVGDTDTNWEEDDHNIDATETTPLLSAPSQDNVNKVLRCRHRTRLIKPDDDVAPQPYEDSQKYVPKLWMDVSFMQTNNQSCMLMLLFINKNLGKNNL